MQSTQEAPSQPAELCINPMAQDNASKEPTDGSARPSVVREDTDEARVILGIRVLKRYGSWIVNPWMEPSTGDAPDADTVAVSGFTRAARVQPRAVAYGIL